MDLFTEAEMARLLFNGSAANRDRDHAPVVKLYLPFTNCVWLLNELEPDDSDIAFGLCDLGMGFPELGSVSLSELKALSIGDGIIVQQDAGFVGHFPMSVYAEAARHERAVTEDHIALTQAAAMLSQNRRYWTAPRPG